MGKVNADMLALVGLTMKMADCHVVNQALLNVYEEQLDRIFVRGLDSSGNTIGDLSTTPGYFNPKDFPKKFKTGGKNGIAKSKQVFSIKTKRTSKTQSAHVTKYFSGGYNEAKTAGGRNVNVPGKVDLYLTGQLKLSWLPELECGKRAQMGFSNDLARDKAEGNEVRFGTNIFDVTEKEIQIFVDTITNA